MMFGITFVSVVVFANSLVLPAPDKPLTNSTLSADGRVAISVVMDRTTVAPGEDVFISVSCTVPGHELVFLPNGNSQPLCFLYIKSPTGDVAVYPQNGTSPKTCRPLELGDYAPPTVFSDGRGESAIEREIPMVNPSPGWLNVSTYEPVNPNLRTEGVYEIWVKYTIPRIENAPSNAWHGTIESRRLRFSLREIPVAIRRDKPTAEQLDHLKVYLESRRVIQPGGYVEPIPPSTVEMPQLSLFDRLRWAMQRTENEGFASHVVALLREQRPKTGEQPYPLWWSDVYELVQHRAYCNSFRGGPVSKPTLRILGPYLDDYVAISIDEMEAAFAGQKRIPGISSYGYSIRIDPGLLVKYCEYKPQSSIRKRLETLARQYAKIPATSAFGAHDTRSRLEISWHLLFAFGILRDGMLFSDARSLLGEPTERDKEIVWWNYHTGARGNQPGIDGKLVDDRGNTVIQFTNRDVWMY